jgi:hypothetical protein
MNTMMTKAIVSGIFVTMILAGICGIISGADPLIPGIISGSSLAAINLWLIMYLVKRILVSSASRKVPLLAITMMGKFLLLSAIIFLLIVKCRVSGLGIILGLTVMLVSVISTGFLMGNWLGKGNS